MQVRFLTRCSFHFPEWQVRGVIRDASLLRRRPETGELIQR